MNQAGIDLVKNFEGFRDHAYKDIVGVVTIGYGFTHGVKMGDTMTLQEADKRLLEELTDLEGRVGYLLEQPATDNQSAALTSFAFNLGIGALAGSTLLRKFNSGDIKGAADEFLKWVHAGGQLIPGLVRRRIAERSLFCEEDS